jgi:hypothetical protein
MLPKLTLHAAAACGLATLALGAGAAPVATTTTVMGKSMIQFACGARGPSCHYLILTSLCNEKMDKDGNKTRTCEYSMAVPPFELKPGETKTVTGLPSDAIYKQTVGKPPTVSDCMNDPTRL